MTERNGHIRTCIVKPLLLCLMAICSLGFTEAQTKRALLVGVSNYQSADSITWATIHGTNDIDLIASTLHEQKFKTIRIYDKAATAKRIRKELRRMIASCRQGDTVYLHFSCHGQPFEDLDGDEDDGWDESLIPYDAPMAYQQGVYEGANHITDDELHTCLLQLRKAVGTTGFVCVVLDACHAGGASRGEDESDDEEDEPFVRGTQTAFTPNGREFRPRINARGNFDVPPEPDASDILILEACRSYQSNYEIKQPEGYYGPLSYYIHQVLSERPLTATLDWVQEVKKRMSADKRLTRQNMVYETSLK